MDWIIAGLTLLGAVVTCFSLAATLALVRTRTLTISQKLAQLLIAWLIPIIGARLVLHLLAEQDVAAIPQKWVPNETINYYVLSALGVPARELTRLAEHTIENEIYSTVVDHLSHASHSADTGGGADSGGGDAGAGH